MSRDDQQALAADVTRPPTPLPDPRRQPPFSAQNARKQRTRIAALVGVGLVLAAGGLALWWNLFRTPPLVGIAAGNGRIEATEIDVASKIAGRVDSVLVDEGDAIEGGSVLAQIDVESLEAQLDEAEAAVEQAAEAHYAAAAALHRENSVRRLAGKEFERAKQLFDAEVAAEDTLDRRRTELETADASVDQAARLLKQAERAIEVAAARARRLRIDIEDGTIRAPRAGRVLYRLTEPGEVLAIGGKVITLVEEGDAYMTVFLPEQQAARVHIGAEAQIRLDGFPDAVWPASVSYVAPKAQFTPKEVETRSEREKLVFKIKVQLPPPVDPVIKPGMRGLAYVRLDGDAAWPDRAR